MKRWVVLCECDEDNGWGRLWHVTEAPDEAAAVTNVLGADSRHGGYNEPYVLVVEITEDPTVVASDVMWAIAKDAQISFVKVPKNE